METTTTNRCSCCYSTYQLEESFCNSCGFPLQGNKIEQDRFISDRNLKEIQLDEMNEAVRKACNSLYWVAGITGVSAVIMAAMARDFAFKFWA